ncbi:MAG: phosphoribosylglycinamide formyltransferase [Desulfovibrionaceae bacterium]|nr:phosphoribosylglycinamide formyltransferase [Desulfovibrionaceae bacterium]
MSLPIAIVASGNGTNAQAMIDLMKAGVLDVDIRLIFCNRPGAKVLARAEAAGIPSMMVDHKAYASREEFDRVMAKALQDSGAEIIVLAGYMRLLTEDFLKAFPRRVVNLHPSLLPAFGGGVHAGPDALAYGVKITGCTVHFVDMKVDSGPVIIQAAVPCSAEDDEDSLMTRIHEMEHRIYPQALQWLAEGRLSISGDRHVRISPAGRERAEIPADCFVWPPLEKGY